MKRFDYFYLLFFKDYGDPSTTPSSNTGYVESNAKNIYYIRKNGLFTLRSAAFSIAEVFYHYYYGMVNDIVINYRIVMIIAIVFLVISQLILIPIVF